MTNVTILQGRFTKDPEIRTIEKTEKRIAKFSFAHNFLRGAGGKEPKALYIDCVAFGTVVDLLEKHCSKGQEVVLEGQLRQEEWEDKKNNNAKRTKIVMWVDRVNFTGSKKSAESAEVV